MKWCDTVRNDRVRRRYKNRHSSLEKKICIYFVGKSRPQSAKMICTCGKNGVGKNIENIHVYWYES